MTDTQELKLQTELQTEQVEQVEELVMTDDSVVEEQMEEQMEELVMSDVADEQSVEVVVTDEPEPREIETDVLEEAEEKEECLVVAKPKHYNDDVYADCVCDDNELRYQMIKKPVEELDDATLLYNFCDQNLEDKFRTVIRENRILPLETTQKVIELKLKKNNDDCRESIKQTINDTFMSYYPEKILTFVNDTVKLLFLERMRNMDREFTCVHKGTYYTIHMTSEYKKVRFGTSYNLVKIKLSTVKFE